MNTSNKGALAESKIKTDLISKGYHVASPEYNNLPFDIILIADKWKLYKIQVKHVTIIRNTIQVRLQTSHAISCGTKKRTYTKNDCDFFAAYVPDIDKCLYIPSDILDTNINSFFIHYGEIKRKRKNIHTINDYEQLTNVQPCSYQTHSDYKGIISDSTL